MFHEDVSRNTVMFHDFDVSRNIVMFHDFDVSRNTVMFHDFDVSRNTVMFHGWYYLVPLNVASFCIMMVSQCLLMRVSSVNRIVKRFFNFQSFKWMKARCT